MKTVFLFVVNVDWFFVSHRLPIGLSLLEKGVNVHLLCSDTGRCAYLEELGFVVHRMPLSRSGVNIFSEFRNFIEIIKVVRSIRPFVVHAVTIKPVIYSGIVSRFAGVQRFVASISGLGYVFTHNSVFVRVLRRVALYLYRIALRWENSRTIFQNRDDMQSLIDAGVVAEEQVVLIRGSGVDLVQYQPKMVDNSIPVVMFLARLLIDKGIREFIESAKMLSQQGVRARFVIVGDIDEGNRNSVSREELAEWANSDFVEYWGFTEKPYETISRSDLIVLPSYREGLPKSLVEAAACGKAVVTTDVPGCRDAVEEGQTGLLVPAYKVDELSEAIRCLVESPEKRKKMGNRGRELAERAFDIRHVIDAHIKLYGLDA